MGGMKFNPFKNKTEAPAVRTGPAGQVTGPRPAGLGGGDDGVEMGAYGLTKRTADRSRDDRRALRIMSFIAIIQVLVIVFLVSTLSALVPMRRDIPYLLQVVPNAVDGGAVASVGPLTIESPRKLVIAKILAMEYARIRHAIIPDAEEMNRRWGAKCLRDNIPADERLCAYVRKHSAPNVYSTFREQNLDEVSVMIAENQSRSVTIDVEPIEKGAQQLEVRFTLTDSVPGEGGRPETIRENSYVATIWYAFDSQVAPKGEEYLNPYGFIVTRYELAKKQD